MKLTDKIHAPLQEICDEHTSRADISLFVKREELIHPQVSGNKWRKLKYNLIEAQHLGKGILTFGGAFSNHIYAAAAAGKLFNIKTIGIIRGDELTDGSNPTLAFAANAGMQLEFTDRSTYRRKNDPDYLEEIKNRFPDYIIIPEGGSNTLALKGTAEITEDIDMDYQYLCCAAGTGGTLAGILSIIPAEKIVLGFPALKGDFLQKDITALLAQAGIEAKAPLQLITGYDFGGYAKIQPALLDFMKTFEARHQILLDPVYTAKMLYGIYDLIKKDYFPKGSTIIAIHTGGLQGRTGFGL